jgi:hypothetical protein
MSDASRIPARSITAALALGVLAIAAIGSSRGTAPLRPVSSFAFAAPGNTDASWRNDPAWYQGKAEWALYDAVRPIYGTPRTYEATIFTNKQMMDMTTTTKASGADGGIEMFKHNVSEMIPTENYTYRFLTTSFVRTDTLTPYKVVASSQEDCGATFKQFTLSRGTLDMYQSSYFPDQGVRQARSDPPRDVMFHDALTLTLRDYPFDAADTPTLKMSLIGDQTTTKLTSGHAAQATVQYVGRETISVPYGEVETHHLRVTHVRDGGTDASEYWFAADAKTMRHVLVRYKGPHGVTYALKALDWWAYWDRSAKRPG